MKQGRKPWGATAPRAVFDAGQQHRKSMIAKVHIAKQQLGLDEDDYRAMLVRITGHNSAGLMNEAQLAAVLAEFEKSGFTAKARPKGPRPADHAVALKARALWISLGHLGAIDNPSEQALEAFARRQLKVDRLQWANQRHGNLLIEALKAIAERHGWDQSTEGVRAAMVPLVLRRRLLAAILTKLVAADMAPAHWRIERAVFEFGGERMPDLMTATTGELDIAAQVLGKALRAATGKDMNA